MNEAEVWRPIEGFPGYEVSSYGNVRCFVPFGPHTGRLLETPRAIVFQETHGYWRVSLWRDRKGYKRFVHRLVLEAFVGPCPKGMETRHLDGDGHNNRLDNLAWGTKTENASDRVEHGTHHLGSGHPRAKISEETAASIKRDLELGPERRGLCREIADRYGTTLAIVHNIKYRTCWKHVKEAA